MMRLAVTAAMMIAIAAQGAETPSIRGESARAVRQYTLEDLDAKLESFKGAVWSATERASLIAADHTGATLELDLARHVLSDKSLALLKDLRDRLPETIPSGSNLIPAAALAPLDELMTGEACRLDQVLRYWETRHFLAYHENLVQPLIERTPADARADFLARARDLGMRRDSLRARMERVLTNCVAISREERTAAEDPGNLVIEYNALRSQIAAGLPVVESELVPVKRPGACPAPASPASRMRVISKPNLSDLYPAEAVRYQVEGKVAVRIEYDSGGCVFQVTVHKSSGADILDKAGLEFGFGIVIQPAEVNGVATGGAASQNLVFSLRDWPGGQVQP